LQLYVNDLSYIWNFVNRRAIYDLENYSLGFYNDDENRSTS